MKCSISLIAFALGAGFAGAQGTLVYDQQSIGTSDGTVLLSQSPFGQSFTPTLDSIGFAQFYLSDGTTPSTVAVNLRSDSITGTILGTSDPVALNASSTGFIQFLFPSAISLVPGTKYYLEPVVVSGGNARAGVVFTRYPGGDAIYSGVTYSDRDLLFGEGIINSTPEPSAASLFCVAGIGLYCCRVKRAAAH